MGIRGNSFQNKVTSFGAAAAALIAVYAALSIWDINLPGLHSDEAFQACGSLQILRGIGPVLRSVRAFGMDFPLMMVDYETAVESYILLPFFSLLGVSTFSLRLAPVLMGALGLALMYLFIKEFFNVKVALFSVALLSFNPVFILETKLGLNSASMLHPLLWGALLLLFRWYKGGRSGYFILSFFIMGAAVAVRVWFLWLLAALAVLGVIYGRRLILRLEGRKLWLGGVSSFAAGNLLFIIFNLTSGLATFRYILGHFNRTDANINNFDYLANLMARLDVLNRYLSGAWSLHEIGSWFNRSLFNPYPFSSLALNSCLPWLFYAGLSWLIWSALTARSSFSRQRLVFLLVLIVVVFILSPFTLSSLGGPHLFLLYPLLVLPVSLLFLELMRHKVASALAWIAVGLVLFSNAYVFADWQRYFRATGGIGNNSEAIVSLTGWLKDNGVVNPVLGDWGMTHTIILLSEGDISPREAFSLEGGFPYGDGYSDKKFIQQCGNSFIDKDTVYVFHSVEFTNLNRYPAFLSLAEKMGRVVVELKRFYQRDGRAIYIVYALR